MRTIVHVGLMKTGTSALQYNVFPRLEGVWYWHWEHSFGRTLRQARSTDSIALFSSEGISASPWTAAGWTETRMRHETALSGLFPQADVLIVLREQGAWCRSLYHQYLHEGGTASFAELFEPHLDDPETSPLLFTPYLQRLREQFAGRILAVDFGLMAKDWNTFRETLEGFFGVAFPTTPPPIHNPSVKRAQAHTLRTLNRIVHSDAAREVERLGGRPGRVLVRYGRALPRPLLQGRGQLLGRIGSEAGKRRRSGRCPKLLRARPERMAWPHDPREHCLVTAVPDTAGRLTTCHPRVACPPHPAPCGDRPRAAPPRAIRDARTPVGRLPHCGAHPPDAPGRTSAQAAHPSAMPAALRAAGRRWPPRRPR